MDSAASEESPNDPIRREALAPQRLHAQQARLVRKPFQTSILEGHSGHHNGVGSRIEPIIEEDSPEGLIRDVAEQDRLRAVEAGKVGCGDMEFVHVGFEEPFRRRTVRARAGLEPRGLIVTGLIWECRDKA